MLLTSIGVVVATIQRQGLSHSATTLRIANHVRSIRRDESGKRQGLTVRRHRLFILRVKVPLKELFVRLHSEVEQRLSNRRL